MAKISEKVQTGPFIASYPNVFTSRKNQKGIDKFSIACVFTDMDEVKRLKSIALDVAKRAFGPDAAERIRKKQIKFPFRDGEEKNYPEGSVFFNASSEQQPGVVSKYKDPATQKARIITDPKALYPGAICRAVLSCYSYDHPEGGKGVSFGLNGLQILDNNEETAPRIDNRTRVEDEFEADDEALAELDDLTSEDEDDQEEEPAPPPAKKAGKAKAAGKRSVLDELGD